MRRPVARNLTVLAVSAAVVVSVGAAAPPAAQTTGGEKTPLAVGYGGAVSSVDPDASAAGIEVLRKGGNAVDAAVATAAALGVTEPYSAGIGGGGYFVYYDAKSRTVRTIDGRETAPLSADKNLFTENGKPIPFAAAVSSGLSVGTPGTPATWQTALDQWGSKRLASVLKPAERLARDGFTVDETFRSQTASNETRFRYFPDTAELFLPGGRLPVVGSTFKNPDLARTYAELGHKGRRRDLPRRPRPGDRRHGQQAARRPGLRLERPPRRPVREGPGRLPHQAPGTHQNVVPRPGRLLHGALVLRRYDGRRGAQHPGADRPVEGEQGAVPAPLHRGEPDRVRGPGAVGG